MRWQKKLSREQMAHVRLWMTPDGTTPTLAAILRTRAAQEKMEAVLRAKDLAGEPCFDCRGIAIRLELED